MLLRIRINICPFLCIFICALGIGLGGFGGQGGFSPQSSLARSTALNLCFLQNIEEKLTSASPQPLSNPSCWTLFLRAKDGGGPPWYGRMDSPSRSAAPTSARASTGRTSTRRSSADSDHSAALWFRRTNKYFPTPPLPGSSQPPGEIVRGGGELSGGFARPKLSVCAGHIFF